MASIYGTVGSLKDTFQPNITLERPEGAESMHPSSARALYRTNTYSTYTSGFCDGYGQSNIIIIPKEFADDFEEFCHKNHGPLPLLYRSKPGEVGAPPLAENSNIRTDLGCYKVWKDGQKIANVPYLNDEFEPIWDNMVTFYIGCSTTFDSVITAHGIDLPDVLDIPWYRSNIQCASVGPFQDVFLTVTMRMIRKDQLDDMIAIVNQYPDYHGAPIHIGDPARIGLPRTEVPDQYVPVFWACGVTSEDVISQSKPPVAVCHYPGCMFISDVKVEPAIIDAIEIIELVRNDREHEYGFSSVMYQKSLAQLENLQTELKKEQNNAKVSDVSKAILTLSHAKRILLVYLPDTFCGQDLVSIISLVEVLYKLRKNVTVVVDTAHKRLLDSAIESLQNYHTGLPKMNSDNVSINVKVHEQDSENTFLTKDAAAVFDCLLLMNLNNGYLQKILDATLNGKPHKYPLHFMSVIAVLDSDTTIADRPLAAEGKKPDFTIVTKFNSAVYGITVGICIASADSYHMRYKNRSIGRSCTSIEDRLELNKILPSENQVKSFWKIIMPNINGDSSVLEPLNVITGSVL